VGLKLRQLPPRLAAGAYILNSGLSKRGLDDDAYAGMQEMAARAVPQLAQMSARDFGKLLMRGEVALGAALLLPVVPSWLVGMGLTGFSAALLRMYRNSPGMTIDGIRPTPEGTAVAKDVFLLGIGMGLVLDHITTRNKKKGLLGRKK